MGFEVVGLPHYVIWHVYEPSVDDLKRMEEMEKEKLVREQDVEDVEVARARWEKDRKAIESVLQKQKQSSTPGLAVQGGAEGPVAHVGEEGQVADRANGLTGIEEEKHSNI